MGADAEAGVGVGEIPRLRLLWDDWVVVGPTAVTIVEVDEHAVALDGAKGAEGFKPDVEATAGAEIGGVPDGTVCPSASNRGSR